MSQQLSREARDLLEQVRAAEEATDEDEARVKRALGAAIAAGVTCHWQRYPMRGDPVSGDGAAPPAAELGKAGAAISKAGLVAWGAPLSALALSAAAWFGVSGGEQTVQHPERSAPSAAPAAAPEEHAGPQHAARPPPGEVTAADAGLPPAASARAAAPSRPKRSARASAAQRPEPTGLAAELALLQRAQAALRRGDGLGALQELEAFPGSGGQLLAERRVARVLALCSLGRVAEAQSLAVEVLRSEPGSVQRVALERSCANPSRNRER